MKCFLYIRSAISYILRHHHIKLLSLWRISRTYSFIEYLMFSLSTCFFFGNVWRLENLIFSSLTSDICARHMKRNNLLFIPSQLLLLTRLCCVEMRIASAKKGLLMKTFLYSKRKCDDIKWKLFDRFFVMNFVVLIIRKLNEIFEL